MCNATFVAVVDMQVSDGEDTDSDEDAGMRTNVIILGA